MHSDSFNEVFGRMSNQQQSDGAGYSLRHYHQIRVDERLETIEKAEYCCIIVDSC